MVLRTSFVGLEFASFKMGCMKVTRNLIVLFVILLSLPYPVIIGMFSFLTCSIFDGIFIIWWLLLAYENSKLALFMYDVSFQQVYNFST